MGKKEFLFWFMILGALVLPGEVSQGDPGTPEYNTLMGKYRQFEPELKKSPWPVPFHVDSAVKSSESRVDLYSVMEFPFTFVKKELRNPSHWCGILSLSNTVRACTFREAKGAWTLTVYSVDRPSDPIDKAYPIKYDFLREEGEDYFNIFLRANAGPFYTKDHSFELESVPLSPGRTFIRLSYSYKYSYAGYYAMEAYSGLFLRGKTGFSPAGKNKDGSPIYVSGIQGGIERNIARYYLAILAYLKTSDVPADQRFEKRVDAWFDLTALFQGKLLGVSREEYLAMKRKDREDQVRLQGTVKNGMGRR